ncbi:MAG: adenylosuccinate lyase [Bacteroidales bacterium]|nr:adenylosuccinate lyase [Bacteroidales bacterium]HOY39261.1 adenylosuccinate lyase [Bacteroidales bacterium]HQP04520.1 adenylosuccinate lyase [Bacteroidales bacterium]
MNTFSLYAVSPIDGRYRKQVESLSAYFSEYSLIRYRLHTEVEYFIALCEIPVPVLADFPNAGFQIMRNWVAGFSESDAIRVKEIESVTNHDVKAIEYLLKEKFDQQGWGKYRELVHFGLTSQDINNTAIPAQLRDFIQEQYAPALQMLIDNINHLSEQWNDVPMLAHTHGQPASPTRLGKEFRVFSARLETQFQQLKAIPFSAKFGGATGNLNAHYVSYPNIDWHCFAERFVTKKLYLSRSYPTTQIEHYDNLAAICNTLGRINTILIDFARDMWTYISMEYFRQKIKTSEVGSSAMPHKVNPIDFENAEGNLGMANTIFTHLAEKLPVSRLQRDLTDSTVLRNLGVPSAHTIIALNSLQKGLGKLLLNEDKISADLASNWAVVAEAIQSILRRENYPEPYETLKALTRKNNVVSKEDIASFIKALNVDENIKNELLQITPYNYIGK